uniref:Uncharacterized protein n=1 Tax=Anguilla anguilla TaxID=7936 RepID=A0A0E9W0R2_ANGAN
MGATVTKGSILTVSIQTQWLTLQHTPSF